MTIDELLVHLDDPKVQDKIKSIFRDNATPENNPSVDDILELEKNKELEQKNEKLNSEKEILEERVRSLEVCISNKDADLSALEQKNEVFKSENEGMNKNIKRLKALILGKDTEISDSSLNIVQLKKKLSELEAKMDDKKNELKLALKKEEDTKAKLNKSDKKLDWYREQFSEDVKIQEIYNDLSDVSKGSLGGIFKSISISGLVACGIQEKNIGNLWEYAKTEVVKDQNPDIQKIIHLFDILFSRFTLAFPIYEVQKDASGDEFDTQLHIKHNSSQNMSGTIESVLLRGYTRNKKVIKQSIVRI